MKKGSQIVVRVEDAMLQQLNEMTKRQREWWDLGIRHGYRSRPTRSEVVRRLILRGLDSQRRPETRQTSLPL